MEIRIKKGNSASVLHLANTKQTTQMQKSVFKSTIFKKGELIDAGHEIITVKEVFACRNELLDSEHNYYMIESENTEILVSEPELQRRLAMMTFL